MQDKRFSPNNDNVALLQFNLPYVIEKVRTDPKAAIALIVHNNPREVENNINRLFNTSLIFDNTDEVLNYCFKLFDAKKYRELALVLNVPFNSSATNYTTNTRGVFGGTSIRNLQFLAATQGRAIVNQPTVNGQPAARQPNEDDPSAGYNMGLVEGSTPISATGEQGNWFDTITELAPYIFGGLSLLLGGGNSSQQQPQNQGNSSNNSTPAKTNNTVLYVVVGLVVVTIIGLIVYTVSGSKKEK